MAKPTTATQTPTPTADQTTTVSGYAIGIFAFIPVDKKDLERQIAVPTLIRDIQNGTKTIADLAGYLHGTDMKANFLNKRFPIEEAKRMLAPPIPATVAPQE